MWAAIIPRTSVELAKHAESLALTPSQYPSGPSTSICLSTCNQLLERQLAQAAPNTDFIIYNIPQLAGVALTQSLFAEMRKNPRVIGVKNSPCLYRTIQMFKLAGGDDYIIFNGPDEQFISGRVIGAEAVVSAEPTA